MSQTYCRMIRIFFISDCRGKVKKFDCNASYIGLLLIFVEDQFRVTHFYSEMTVKY